MTLAGSCCVFTLYTAFQVESASTNQRHMVPSCSSLTGEKEPKRCSCVSTDVAVTDLTLRRQSCAAVLLRTSSSNTQLLPATTRPRLLVVVGEGERLDVQGAG